MKSEIDLVLISPLTRALEMVLVGFPSHHQIVMHYDHCEIGSAFPENQARPMQVVVQDLKEWWSRGGRRHNNTLEDCLDVDTFRPWAEKL